MRVLFTANPMYGHVNPLLPLALAAQHAGHEVVVATGSDVVPHVAGRGLATWTVGPSYAEAGGGPSADWLTYFARSAELLAADLLPRAVDWRPDLVVSEDTELAGPVVAAAAGARHVVHGIGLMPSIGIWGALAPAVDRLLRRWPAGTTAEDLRAVTYLELCPPALRPPGERIWPDSRDLRPVAGGPRPGEQLPPAFDELPHADTVHLTLGTVFNGNRDVLRAALAGLASLPVNVVATVGPGVDPAVLGPQPEHVLLAPYLPHTLLLPRCRAVVSQGGAGILFGTLEHGLPQLVLPQGGDQFGNAEACARAGAGLALPPADVTADAVAAAMTRLLDESSFAAAAAAVQAEFAAMPTAELVLKDLTAG